MINPATGQLMTEFGPLASAEVILLDEINRIPLKSQSAFLEGLQDRSITVGKETYQLPAFSCVPWLRWAWPRRSCKIW